MHQLTAPQRDGIPCIRRDDHLTKERTFDMTKETQSNFKDMVAVFYFVQLPWGDWTIARQDSQGDWWLCDDCSSPMETEYFRAIGDYIPIPNDGNHLNIQW
jgi:hypothetical protein